MKIKVCGLTRPENIQAVAALGVDRLGLVFYPGSPRYAGRDPALAAWCREHQHALPGLTGVFVNEEERTIQETIAAYGLDFVQLHGQEPPALCARIRMEVPVVKAFAAGADFDPAMLQAYMDSCSAFLFDTPTQGYGGSGQAFDWDLLHRWSIPCPFWLAGGIGPQDAVRIKSFDHPLCTGIELNSRFEQAPGIKQIAQLKTFIDEIRN